VICTAFAIRRYQQPDGVLRVLEREELPEGCPSWSRWFTVEAVPKGRTRANHAHRRCHQVFVMLRGSCLATIEAPDGQSHSQELTAARSVAMWVPPWRWVQLAEWSDDGLLAVFASVPYDYPAEYIEDRDEFFAGVEA
jgi:UDP-2-acetamido-3-amino-2,3-dideoxy-glucuronate N-acetyltransferase